MLEVSHFRAREVAAALPARAAEVANIEATWFDKKRNKFVTNRAEEPRTIQSLLDALHHLDGRAFAFTHPKPRNIDVKITTKQGESLVIFLLVAETLASDSATSSPAGTSVFPLPQVLE